MKKRRYLMLFLTIAAACLCLCGCAPVYEVKINCPGYNDDKNYMVDILIPITEDDEDYEDINLNGVHELLLKTKVVDDWYYYDTDESVEAAKKWELYSYDVDGYRSSTVHHNRYYSYGSFWYDFRVEDYFHSYCLKYKTCKIAVVDNDGNLVKVSDEVPMVIHRRYTLDPEMTFDTDTGKVSVGYSYHASDYMFWRDLIKAALINIGQHRIVAKREKK